MPRVPRDVTQDAVIRVFRRAGGVEITSRGKGSHRSIQMPNGEVLTIPYHVKAGLLNACIKQASITLEDFLDLL